MFAWDDDWLAGSAEAAVETGIPIADAHHHLWARPDRPTYLAADYLADSEAHDIRASVFVECGWGYRPSGPRHLRSVGETAAAAVAARTGFPDGHRLAAVVAFADLTDTAHLDEALDAHEDAGARLLRGVRHSAATHAAIDVASARSRPPGLLRQADFRDSLQRLGERGLVFDAWLYHPQLPDFVELASAVPGTMMVLDHLGGPLGVGPYRDRRASVLASWRADLSDLATCPNVRVKLSGIGMPEFGAGFQHRSRPPASKVIAEAWGDPIRYVIDTFGADRCMFGSNFPVDKVSFPLANLWNAFKDMTRDLPAGERAALFSGTARAVYRI